MSARPGRRPALPVIGRRILAVAAAQALALGLGACGAGGARIHHYLPGVVDDALSGALTYGPLAPPGAYRLGGGPGGDGRGCRTTSAGPAGPPGAPGVTFACVEDFDAPGTADHVQARYRVEVGTADCWYAHLAGAHFVRADGRGQPATVTGLPPKLYGCGLAAVESG